MDTSDLKIDLKLNKQQSIYMDEINSCSMERYDLKDTIEDMFNHLKGKELYEDLRLEQVEQMG